MKKLVLLCILVVSVSAAHAVEIVQTVSWDDTTQFEEVNGVVAVLTEDGLRITRQRGENPLTVRLARIDGPAITQAMYALVGEVRYSDVEGDAYLEMWSQFPNGHRYFSRTAAADGPRGLLTGSADWRGFELPYTSSNDDIPERLEFNVHFPGLGSIELSPVELVEYSREEQEAPHETDWFSGRTGGILGGSLGALIGLCGAVVGMLASRGRSRAVAVGMTLGLTVFGGLVFLVGVFALFDSQPWAVCAPLLLPGGTAAVLFGMFFPTVRRQYEHNEIKRNLTLHGDW